MTSIRHLFLQVPPPLVGSRQASNEHGADKELRPLQWSALIREELRQHSSRQLLSAPLRTLLVGGWPSTALGGELAFQIRDILGSPLLDEIEEWTVELSPEDVIPELLQPLQEVGVTRPSLRLLSLSEVALERLGERHDPDTGRRAIALLSANGFPTWSVDILFALPRDGESNPIRTLEEVVATGAPHISLYEFVAHGDPVLGGSAESQGSLIPEEEERAEEYLQAANFLVREGYEPYEMTGFALPGHTSRHAVAILEGRSYLGAGPGAESFIDGRLSRNLHDWAEYSRHLLEGRSIEGEHLVLEREGAQFFQIWSRLKLRSGLVRSELSKAGQALGERWVREGFALRDPDRVALTLEGWLRLDGLAREMARAEMPR